MTCHILFRLVLSYADLLIYRLTSLKKTPGFARIPAARELMLSIPPEVTSEAVNHPIEGPELIHFRNFFEVWDGFAALNAVRAAEPVDSTAQKLQTLDWRKQYSVSDVSKRTISYPFVVRVMAFVPFVLR